MADKAKYYNVNVVPESNTVNDRIILRYNELNYCLNGLQLDRITLLIAPTNSGKTCFSSSMIIDAVSQGYNTFLFAGEDGGAEARDRLYRQYLGNDKNNYDYMPYMLNSKKTNAGDFIIKHEAYVKATEFFGDHLFIYNNNIEADKNALLGALEAAYKEANCRFFLLDNVDMFNLEGGNYFNENEALKDICIALRQFAISRKVHIVIVSHIKKTERNICRPEIFDCKGTSTLTNIAKNILSIIRMDTINPNTKEYKALRNVIELNGYNPDECNACIEILKTKGRRNGIIGMKFNTLSNTFLEQRRNKGEETREDQFVAYPKNKTLEEIAEEAAIIDDIF